MNDDDRRQIVVKTIGGDRGAEIVQSAIVQGPDDAGVFGVAGAIPPPYDPAQLTEIAEHSNALRPNVDGYAVNIDGFGHRMEPYFATDGPQASKLIADAMFVDRLVASPPGAAPSRPTEAEVAAKIAQIQIEQARERAVLDAFFASCCEEMSFPALRRATRTDREITGNAYWEVLRDSDGAVRQFVFAPSLSIRLVVPDQKAITIQRHRRVSPLTFEVVPRLRRFRRFIQQAPGRRSSSRATTEVVGASTAGGVVWFKEYGDPRALSSTSGAFYDTVDALKIAEPTSTPATEILHFRVFSPRSAYGVPRWACALASVLGSRASEEINFLYFDNKTIPPMAILVSGGRLSGEAEARIAKHIEQEIKGRRNYHKILILEAESSQPGADSSRARITIQPLTSVQQSDALFQRYDERNIDKVGTAFRMPRLLRGDVRDFNRATADAALAFAEQQVFQPEREDFDHEINRLLVEAGIRHHRFVSNSPLARDPVQLAEMIARLVERGVLTPAEGREIARDVFNRDLPPVDAEWTTKPIQISVAEITHKAAAVGGQPLEQQALALLRLRDELRGAERDGYGEIETEVVKVPDEEFAAWFDRLPPETPAAASS